MHHFIKLIVILPSILMVACSSQTPEKPAATTDSGNSVTAQTSKKTASPEVKEKEILKPGKLQVKVPVDIPLPESAIVAMGTNLGASGKKHFYIQIPDMEPAQKVTEYFAAELPKHGWELLNGSGEERLANTISLDFKKGNELGRVDCIIKQERAGTIVHIHLEPVKK